MSYPDGMGRVWILQTETKGTGANMVPLERVLTKPSASAAPLYVPPKPPERPPEAPKPRQPRKFRVVDVMTREVLADEASAREAIAALAGLRSIVDVNLYLWQPERERWRMLTFEESSEMWKLREPAGPKAGDSPAWLSSPRRIWRASTAWC